MAPGPPFVDEELATTFGERETLRQFLNHHRWVLAAKLRGLSDSDARRTLVPTGITLLGLVRHATVVERNWFHHVVGGRREARHGATSAADDTSWSVGPDLSVDDVLTRFARDCAESDEIAAGWALDDLFAHERLGQVSLRYVYVHLIREHSRHAGHADILRELTDGSTGDPNVSSSTQDSR